MNDTKLYCIRRGKYSYEIYCCENGTSWDEAMAEFIEVVKS